jgi:ribosome maturation factor RimP
MAQRDMVTMVEELLLPITTSRGMELVEVEYRREGRQMILRIFIDKPDGVNLDDCAEVSRELSAILDVDDLVPEHYSLEVSSPGLNRPLKGEADFRKYVGRLVKVRTYELVADEQGNKRKTFLGTLKGFEGGAVLMALVEGQGARIPLESVAKANLEFEF